MHACRMLKKNRSLVVNLTHEITGTDVADSNKNSLEFILKTNCQFDSSSHQVHEH